MKIIIKGYKDKQVLFESEYGIGITMWNGKMLTILLELYVELDINVSLVFGIDVSLINATIGKISNSENVCIIVGEIESIDEDDYVKIRIGKDLLCCIIDGTKDFVGKFVEIRTSNLELTNINY